MNNALWKAAALCILGWGIKKRWVKSAVEATGVATPELGKQHILIFSSTTVFSFPLPPVSQLSFSSMLHTMLLHPSRLLLFYEMEWLGGAILTPHWAYCAFSKTAAIWYFHSFPGIVSQASSGAWSCRSRLLYGLTDRKRHRGCRLQMKCRILSL